MGSHSTGQKAKKPSMIEFHIRELENRLGNFPNAPITDLSLQGTPPLHFQDAA
jgi:hypothetical protein